MESINKSFAEDLPLDTISVDKVKILIELNVLEFSTTNLNGLRANHPELLMEFIAVNLTTYLQTVRDGTIYDFEELINILDFYKDAPVRTQKNIIDQIIEPVTIVDKNYHTYVVNYILKTKFKLEDLDYLIQNYEDLGKSTQSYIQEISSEHIDHILEFKINLNQHVLVALLYNIDINLVKRRLLFSRNIQYIDRNRLKEIFELLNFKEFIEVVNDIRLNYPIDLNESTENILVDLRSRKLISTFRKANDKFRVNSNHKKNLI